ncbi:MAG: hypothetical protein ACRDYF_00930 [Acidimicrobiia bacterium]
MRVPVADAGSLDGMTTEEGLDDYIGLTEAEAQRKAEGEGLAFRSFGPGEPITAERRSGRVTVFVVDGRVVKADLA